MFFRSGSAAPVFFGNPEVPLRGLGHGLVPDQRLDHSAMREATAKSEDTNDNQKDDLWFHAQKIHGSHVILKTNGQEDIPENVIFEAAKLAKENSKGADSSVVPVDYCQIKFVKRAQNRKLGMVNYTNFNTILVK